MSTMGSSESKDSRPKNDAVLGGEKQSASGSNAYTTAQAQEPAAAAVVGGGSSQYSGAGDANGSQGTDNQTATDNASYYSIGSTGGWIAETDARIINSALVPPGYSTAPNVPAGEITKGCEPCVNPPKRPTGMKLFQAMRREWRTKTVEPPPAPTIDDVDPDDIADAIEDTPGDFLEPPVHLPVMLDILIDIWEDNGLYD